MSLKEKTKVKKTKCSFVKKNEKNVLKNRFYIFMTGRILIQCLL